MVRKIFPKSPLKKALLIMLASILLYSSSCNRGEEPEHEEEMHGDAHSDHIKLDPESMKAADIKTEKVSLRSLASTLEVPGKVHFNENKLAHIGSRVPGRVVEIRVNLGDEVKEGDSLAVIDSTDLGATQSEYLKARANLLAQEKSYERAKKLLEGKAISLGEYQKREAEYITVRADFEAAKDRLYLLGLSGEEVKRIVSEGAINSKVAIRAPFSGTVVERHITLGQVIEPATDLFTLADLSTLWVIAGVPEKDIPSVEPELPVEIKVAPYPEESFKGTLAYVGDQIDPSTRAVNVRAEVDNSLGKLKPEMFATMKISTAEREDVLAIPESALQREGEKTIVFVARGKSTFEKRVVTVGPEADGFYQVLSGIRQGEVIVTKGAFTLKSELQKGEMDEHGH